MRSTLRAIVMLTLATPLIAFANTTPPTIPDGPVASPPGWSCSASGGVVTCTRIPQKEK